jgi:hypothetical protein
LRHAARQPSASAIVKPERAEMLDEADEVAVVVLSFLISQVVAYESVSVAQPVKSYSFSSVQLHGLAQVASVV